MTLAEIEAAIETALATAEKLAPLGAVFGPVGAAAGAAIAGLAALGEKLLAEIAPEAEIIASGDLTRIRALQASLQAQNAVLAGQVAAS